MKTKVFKKQSKTEYNKACKENNVSLRVAKREIKQMLKGNR